LCRVLLKRIATEAAIPVPVLSADMLLHLAQLPLHGNVRELENLLHRAVAMSDGDELQIDAVVGFASLGEQTMPAPLASDFAPTGSAPLAREISARTRIPNDLQGHLDQHEREILLRALQETRFNRTAAAARLGISLRQIRYRIARLNIDVPQGQEASDESA
jgi:two-component system, NtrC family, response regulator PilR